MFMSETLSDASNGTGTTPSGSVDQSSGTKPEAAHSTEQVLAESQRGLAKDAFLKELQKQYGKQELGVLAAVLVIAPLAWLRDVATTLNILDPKGATAGLIAALVGFLGDKIKHSDKDKGGDIQKLIKLGKEADISPEDLRKIEMDLREFNKDTSRFLKKGSDDAALDRLRVAEQQEAERRRAHVELLQADGGIGR